MHGHELSRLDDRAIAAFRNQTVGFVYQSFHLLPHLSARQNVSLPSFFRAGGRADPADVRRRAGRCLDRVGLEHAAERHPLHLSGGERQRVAIARALFQEPRLILCDEPTGSLDSETGEHILGLFAELNRELGVTVVMVTHEPSVAARADRVVRVQDGRVVEAAP